MIDLVYFGGVHPFRKRGENERNNLKRKGGIGRLLVQLAAGRKKLWQGAN